MSRLDAAGSRTVSPTHRGSKQDDNDRGALLDGGDGDGGGDGGDTQKLLTKATSSSSSSKHDPWSDQVPQSRWARLKESLNPGFPPSIKYIISQELAERFSYYGMRAILVLYFKDFLEFGPDSATAMYHVFVVMAYFTPLLGGIISDSWWGKYKTIIVLSLIYSLGNIVVSVTAIPGVTGTPPHWWGVLIGLTLIAIGTGGIKPCVSAFGGDQFVAGQERQLSIFFSMFYAAINTGSFMSMIITPMLRSDVHCFDRDNCFPLAFGVPAALIIVATGIFIAGSRLYRRVPPPGNVIVSVVSTVKTALVTRFRGNGPRKAHWLDYAEGHHSRQTIENTKSLMRVLLIFLPLPVFWTLYDQQGSRWTLQAEQMSGDLGPLGTLKPDQMQAVNAVLILIMIPVFQKVVYPLCERFGLKLTPLRKMGAGMILTAVAFVIAAFVQFAINDTLFDPSYSGANGARLTVINGFSQPLKLNITQPAQPLISLQSPAFSIKPYMDVYNGPATFSAFAPSAVDPLTGSNTLSETSVVSSHTMSTVVFFPSAATAGAFDFVVTDDDLENRLPEPSQTAVRLIHAAPGAFPEGISLVLADGPSVARETEVVNVAPGTASAFTDVAYGTFILRIVSSVTGDVVAESAGDISLGDGAVMVVVLTGDSTASDPASPLKVTTFTYVEPKDVSMMLQLPQYIVMTAAEVLFSITGLEFAYSQSPASMKAVATAAWQLTVAFGNLIVVIVAESRPFDNQAYEFFFFAGLLAAVTIVFAWLASMHTYVTVLDNGDDSDKLDDKSPLATSRSSTEDYGSVPTSKLSFSDA
ncbi:hypothetical protein CAOG_08746 [Capsaspora owczarzaki ATCC 30864]|uniref:Uncharacterized protein n=1 Tax=Capsaspora owczarzaki (strain ATCC 30864) TaxID=595528 RepID=A0A0D2X2T9_CAPO3|nr:hypothetical protein CAOG_08746 [Capsaspora owczarzaki ATCC 30864]KJE93139.1 hypothetical protein CAOG_008746 [Capsaspora owczarzaki ATCC 30864]|eukprot:XP_011270376.1 hypothetical protein CAOG_08746 [Capsaspora owczarzaki ATCC 30864]